MDANFFKDKTACLRKILDSIVPATGEFFEKLFLDGVHDSKKVTELKKLAGPLHDVALAKDWGKPEDEAALRARVPVHPGFGADGKGRTDLRADMLMPGLHELLVKMLGGDEPAGRTRTNEHFALIVRLVGLVLNPEFGRRGEKIVQQFVKRVGRTAQFSAADVKSLARALAKAVSVADYRFAAPPTTAMVIDWIRSLVTGSTTEDCHELAWELAEEFGGWVQLKYPPAPGTPAAKAAFGVTPLL